MNDFIYKTHDVASEAVFLIRRKDGNYNCFTKRGEMLGFIIIDGEMAFFYGQDSICAGEITVEKLNNILE